MLLLLIENPHMMVSRANSLYEKTGCGFMPSYILNLNLNLNVVVVVIETHPAKSIRVTGMEGEFKTKNRVLPRAPERIFSSIICSLYGRDRFKMQL